MKSIFLLALGARGQDDDVFDGPAERYFFTTSTTTTTSTTPVPTTSISELEACWKCDQMSYSECASSGEYTFCSLGEANSCFYEVREVQGSLKQLCTGCKQADACAALQGENFRDVNSVDSLNDQCRPDYRQQRGSRRNGPQQSVCRTCSQTCRSDLFGSAFCFGSISSNVGKEFMVPFATHVTEYPGLTGTNPTDTLVLGIPTFAFLDGTLDDTACDSIEDFTHHNIYFNNNSNGKLRPNSGDNIRTLDEMTFWALQGQTRTWWATNLANVQSVYNDRLVAGVCTESPNTDASYNLSNCGFGFSTLAYP